MEKTVKLHAYSEDAKSDTARSNLTEDQNKSLELAKKNSLLEEEKKRSLEYLNTIEQLKGSLKQEQAKVAEMTKKAAGLDANILAVKDAQLEEEKSRTLENLKTIVQLRESLKQEQAKLAEMAKKTVELEAKVKESSLSGATELVKKNTQLEEEKKNSLEQAKIIEQLRESLKQEQAKAAEMIKKTAELESKIKELPALESKVKELTEAFGKITAIAAMGRAS